MAEGKEEDKSLSFFLPCLCVIFFPPCPRVLSLSYQIKEGGKCRSFETLFLGGRDRPSICRKLKCEAFLRAKAGRTEEVMGNGNCEGWALDLFLGRDRFFAFAFAFAGGAGRVVCTEEKQLHAEK